MGQAPSGQGGGPRALRDKALAHYVKGEAALRAAVASLTDVAQKKDLHGSIRMFNSSVEVLLALHTCQRLFLLPPLEECKTDNITWTPPVGTEDPSFCRFFMASMVSRSASFSASITL